MRLWKRPLSTDIRLLEPLGEGLTSQVYKAIRKHRELGVEQTVAVKILKSRKKDQTLKNEIELLTQIESQHCVRLLGWTDLSEGPAMVLEYLDGVSLFDLCVYERLSELDVNETVAQLQAGLSDLHGFGVVHGDLSPKNIFVTTKGVIKILDFGFSAKAERSVMFGTPQFLAIEGWEGKNLSPQSDLFSLGLLREDLMAGTVLGHETQNQWRRRAGEIANTSSLLALLPKDRRFLDLSSSSDGRKRLSLLVRQTQKKRKAFKNTTRVLKLASVTAPSVNYLSLIPFLFVFFFFNNLQPASLTLTELKIRPEAASLDVRSHDWARVSLHKISPGLNSSLGFHSKSVYTPYRFRNLSPGSYKLHWATREKTGIIFVQLQKSQRILIR